jgi:glycosyltransferase involved in cell wall biosynthesis
MPTLTCSVVIRALNEAEHIGRLLHGLERQTRRPDEVILVDSGSSDDTVAIAEKHGARIVHIAKEEFSFGRALNRGCEAATSESLLFVSAHVYPVYDTYLERMLAPMEALDAVGIAYGRQVGDDRTKYSEGKVMHKWFPDESVWDQGHPFSNNANALVRRSVWNDLRYDEELTGLEDLEFAKRAQALGVKVSYVADAPVVHVHEESWDAVRNRYRREAIAYARIMGDGHIGASEAVRLAVSNAFSDAVHAARDRVLLRTSGEILRFRAAQFYGSWQGFRDGQNISRDLKRRFYYPMSPLASSEPEEPGNRIPYDDPRP